MAMRTAINIIAEAIEILNRGLLNKGLTLFASNAVPIMAGSVPKPKQNINTAASIELLTDTLNARAVYTSPQGIIPQSMPRKKAEVGDLTGINFAE